MIYRHYKGGDYEFVALAHIEATLEPVVVYRSCTTSVVFARPAAEFFGTINASSADPVVSGVTVRNGIVPRFTPQGR